MTTVADKLAPQIARPFYDFTIPESDRELESDPHAITIQSLLTLQEADADTEAGGNFGYKGVWARATRSLVAIDGKPINAALSPTDNWSPKVRDHLVAAYGIVHNVSPESRAALKASMVRRMA